ncbi:MAG: FG-GAP repeat domain-containing protein [Planctomycetota bacterium]
MRLIRTVIAVVFVSMVFGSGTPSCKESTREERNVNAEQGDSNDDTNDLSAYYGFEEIEIIKLERGIKGLRTVDFNGDGRNDIAVVNNRKAKIELLIQKERVGPGETEVAVDPEDVDINQINPPTRFQRQSVAVAQQVFSLACGDLNSDGMPDLAFYGEPKGLYVMLQKAGEAEADKPKRLSWRTRKKIKIDDGLSSTDALVCADLNNDGADDLALAGRDAVYIVVQKEDGSLAEPVKYPTIAPVRGIVVGDLNGDNINDLITVTSNGEKQVHVRFGLKTGQLGPQEQFFIEKPFQFKVHNIDNEVGDEILTVAAVSQRLICYKLAAEKEKDADWPSLFYPLASGEGQSKRDLVVGDFDGDGLADVIVSEPGAAELVFYKQTAELGLSEPVRFPGLADTAGLSVADIDDDGKAELAVLSVKEKVIGFSEFEDDRLSFPKPIDLTGEPVAMELADADGNGSIDCVYISKDSNDVRFLRVIYNSYRARKRGGNLDKLLANWKEVGETGRALELKKLVSNPDGLKVLDVDQDGLQDVLIFVKYQSPILVRQKQKGEFEVVDRPGAQASLIKDASLSSIAIADVDGQAGKELLLAQKNFARSLVFADGRSWSIVDQYNAKSKENKISAVAAFDIDGEGPQKRPAILLLDGQKGQLQILKAGDDKTYRFEKELDVGKWNAATHLKMLFAPLTGSGVRSILLFDSEKFTLITPPTGDNVPEHLEQQFSYETKIKDGAYGNLTAGDINRDERADIVMVEYKRNHIEILALDSQIKPIPAMRFKIFEEKSYRQGKRGRGKFSIEPRELKIADVTSDGKDDLITVIHDRIIIYPQD